MKKINIIYIKSIFLLMLSLVFVSGVFSQAGTYYNSISTSSATFVNDLETRIRSPYTRIAYDQFDETNIANFASRDNGDGTRSVFCVYSGYEYIYSGVFTWGTMSREHTYAQSWMPTYPSTNVDQYSDQYHLFPTEQNHANGVRSNHPLGIVANIVSQFLEAKYGTNTLGQSVYEPRDVHKGDAARALLYMCIRYDGIGGYDWTFNWLNGTRLPSLSEAPEDVNLLLSWNRQDPPDKWEVDRNNYVQSIQQNRNPFVDHPEYTSYIDFSNLTKLNPVYATEPTNYVTGFASGVTGNSIQVSWNDATGAQLPSGYLLIAYNKDNYFLPVDGSQYANDTLLTDGFAEVNIPYVNANNYNFSNLVSGNTYYFTIYSYNGTGTQINYKIDGTFPQTNSSVAGSFAAEPSNYITNFTPGTITSNSIQLNWTDALPGIQVPSGYLLVANNNNIFSTPSDGVAYGDDINLSDGSAKVNISYSAANTYTFNSLFTNTNYYFRMYSYNGSGTQINYKTDGIVPFVNAMTTGTIMNTTTVLLDNFNRANNNILGNTLAPEILTWQESETQSLTSISISANKTKLAGTTAGREFAYLDIGTISGYPSQFSTATAQLVWAINFKQSRADPSGFDNNNYGAAFILGKSTFDVSTGNGYAIVIGQSGSTDAIRFAKFTGGVNANSRFTNIITNGDYANQYLSMKVVYDPAGNNWSLYVDSSSTGFPQADPRNTASQIGFASDNTYTGTNLPYLGILWNHATSANDSLIFDDLYAPSPSSTILNITAIVEGFYNTSSNKLNMKDTVTAYLRNSSSPFAVADSSKSIIDSLTFQGTFTLNTVSTGNYYIELIHRNSIETWSKLPQVITNGSINNFNFTTSQTQAFGDNLVLVNGKYCIYSGDANQDGAVDISDIILIYNDAGNFASGYVKTDINGDSFVDLSDEIITFNNSSIFVLKITP